jgi:hypothetical protein
MQFKFTSTFSKVLLRKQNQASDQSTTDKSVPYKTNHFNIETEFNPLLIAKLLPVLVSRVILGTESHETHDHILFSEGCGVFSTLSFNPLKTQFLVNSV